MDEETFAALSGDWPHAHEVPTNVVHTCSCEQRGYEAATRAMLQQPPVQPSVWRRLRGRLSERWRT